MIELEAEQTLRIDEGSAVEIACAAGVLWVTLSGDPHDMFVAHGETLRLARGGSVVITALERALVDVRETNARPHWTAQAIAPFARWRILLPTLKLTLR